MQIRVGVSSGEATHEDDDLYGPPVVEAARLCAAADAGQILVADVVRTLARGKGHSFTSVGELTLKGLPEPVAASEVGWEPAATGIPLPARLATAPAIAMVGREREQEALATAWARAKDGQRQVVLLSGEPGIGKTRLATEAARVVHTEGAVVLLGTCDEDVNLPYQPFVEALRHYVTHAPDEVLATRVREHKGELGRLVPDLGRRVADLPAPQVAEAETERYLLFEAITGLLSEASQQDPLVLILDDLQWAGAPELLLLRHMLRTAMPLRLLIIGTYRDTDLTRTHPLTAVLADLRRETGVERLPLGGLDETAVVSFLAAAAGHNMTEPGIALAKVVHKETEGSPFFIGEILRHLSESGAIFQENDRWTYKTDIVGLGIPEGIKEVIGRRLARLAETTNKVLSLAAVIGRQFDLALLARIAEISEEAVLDALDGAIGAALVAEVPGTPDCFGFSHALIRTTLYEELGTARRARLHRKVGEALEEMTQDAPGARIDELAHHWLHATQVADAAKAIGYARQAGDKALANLAFEEAAAHYERALAVLETPDRASQELRCDLLLALAEAERGAGNQSYREAVSKAVEAARALGDGERLARAALANARPGGFMASGNVVDEQLIALYEEALAVLRETDSMLRARLLGQLAVELVYTLERERRDEVSREAVEIAPRLSDRTGRAQVQILRLLAMNDPFMLAERLDLTAELRQPFYVWGASVGRAMFAVMRGAPEAEKLVFAALDVGTASDQPDAPQAFGAQLYNVCHNQGRLAELTDVFGANVEAQPHIPAWRASTAKPIRSSKRASRSISSALTISSTPSTGHGPRTW